MEFTFHKPAPAARATRIALVIALHVALLWGLSNGLHRVPMRTIERELVVFFQPETEPTTKPEPPKVKPSAPAKVETTTVAPPVIEVATQVPTDAPVIPFTESPSGNLGTPSTATGATEALSGAGLAAACPNAQAVRSTLRYPVLARRDGLEGDVVARFIVGADGAIRDVTIASSTNRAFNSTVAGAVREFQCKGLGRDVAVEVPFSFRLN